MFCAICSCGTHRGATDARPTVTVSILPLKYLVERVAGDTSLRIDVLVPPGSSPELFEPTPMQLAQFSRSDLYFAIGLIDFEQALGAKLAGQERPRLVNLSAGAELLAGHCHHDHHEYGHHHHGTDPHIWASCREMARMVGLVEQHLAAAYPEGAQRFAANAQAMRTELASLDARIAHMLDSAGRKHFLIYHPALAYFARDYGLTQLSVEHEGKEPSAQGMAATIAAAREHGVGLVMVQQQFDSKSASAIADELRLPVVQVNPLAEDWPTEMLRTAQLIAGIEHSAN
ncbi:MAG: zinc ABC transporter substrate-binding protein [Bacteroidales bacterium]|nr:zinc ABC transporter substrate-binding protein [Bacteroidales bacterium]